MYKRLTCLLLKGEYKQFNILCAKYSDGEKRKSSSYVNRLFTWKLVLSMIASLLSKQFTSYYN